MERLLALAGPDTLVPPPFPLDSPSPPPNTQAQHKLSTILEASESSRLTGTSRMLKQPPTPSFVTDSNYLVLPATPGGSFRPSLTPKSSTSPSIVSRVLGRSTLQVPSLREVAQGQRAVPPTSVADESVRSASIDEQIPHLFPTAPTPKEPIPEHAVRERRRILPFVKRLGAYAADRTARLGRRPMERTDDPGSKIQARRHESRSQEREEDGGRRGRGRERDRSYSPPRDRSVSLDRSRRGRERAIPTLQRAVTDPEGGVSLRRRRREDDEAEEGEDDGGASYPSYRPSYPPSRSAPSPSISIAATTASTIRSVGTTTCPSNSHLPRSRQAPSPTAFRSRINTFGSFGAESESGISLDGGLVFGRESRVGLGYEGGQNSSPPPDPSILSVPVPWPGSDAGPEPPTSPEESIMSEDFQSNVNISEILSPIFRRRASDLSVSRHEDMSILGSDMIGQGPFHLAHAPSPGPYFARRSGPMGTLDGGAPEEERPVFSVNGLNEESVVGGTRPGPLHEPTVVGVDSTLGPGPVYGMTGVGEGEGTRMGNTMLSQPSAFLVSGMPSDVEEEYWDRRRSRSHADLLRSHMSSMGSALFPSGPGTGPSPGTGPHTSKLSSSSPLNGRGMEEGSPGWLLSDCGLSTVADGVGGGTQALSSTEPELVSSPREAVQPRGVAGGLVEVGHLDERLTIGTHVVRMIYAVPSARALREDPSLILAQSSLGLTNTSSDWIPWEVSWPGFRFDVDPAYGILGPQERVSIRLHIRGQHIPRGLGGLSAGKLMVCGEGGGCGVVRVHVAPAAGHALPVHSILSTPVSQLSDGPSPAELDGGRARAVVLEEEVEEGGEEETVSGTGGRPRTEVWAWEGDAGYRRQGPVDRETKRRKFLSHGWAADPRVMEELAQRIGGMVLGSDGGRRAGGGGGGGGEALFREYYPRHTPSSQREGRPRKVAVASSSAGRGGMSRTPSQSTGRAMSIVSPTHRIPSRSTTADTFTAPPYSPYPSRPTAPSSAGRRKVAAYDRFHQAGSGMGDPTPPSPRGTKTREDGEERGDGRFFPSSQPNPSTTVSHPSSSPYSHRAPSSSQPSVRKEDAAFSPNWKEELHIPVESEGEGDDGSGVKGSGGPARGQEGPGPRGKISATPTVSTSVSLTPRSPNPSADTSPGVDGGVYVTEGDVVFDACAIGQSAMSNIRVCNPTDETLQVTFRIEGPEDGRGTGAVGGSGFRLVTQRVTIKAHCYILLPILWVPQQVGRARGRLWVREQESVTPMWVSLSGEGF